MAMYAHGHIYRNVLIVTIHVFASNIFNEIRGWLCQSFIKVFKALHTPMLYHTCYIGTASGNRNNNNGQKNVIMPIEMNIECICCSSILTKMSDKCLHIAAVLPFITERTIYAECCQTRFIQLCLCKAFTLIAIVSKVRIVFCGLRVFQLLTYIQDNIWIFELVTANNNNTKARWYLV